jgi:hypothetical protein
VGNKLWYQLKPELYATLKREVEDKYPDLKFSLRDGAPLITGYFPLFEGERVYDRYLIEIELPKESPRGLPTVREMGGRIQRVPDCHINPDGTACVVLPDAFWHENPDGMSLMEFLNGPLRGYFASQSLVESGVPNPWPAGEWKHGASGIIDFYSQLLETQDPQKLRAYFKILTSKKIRGHWPCPCGKQRLRSCPHHTLVDRIRSRIPRKLLVKSAEALMKHSSH